MTELDPILGAALAAIGACLCVALGAYWLSGDWRQTFTAVGDDVEGRRRFELGALASTDLRFVKNDEERFARLRTVCAIPSTGSTRSPQRGDL